MFEHVPSQWKLPEDAPKMRLVTEDDCDEGSGDCHLERRSHRRFDVEARDIALERWEGRPNGRPVLGKVLDLSAGGIRIRTSQASVHVDQQLRVRLELPDNGGISPFVDCSGPTIKPKREWVGWLAVSRVQKSADNNYEVAGRLVDMEEMDRGMLGLYLSTQPLAA